MGSECEESHSTSSADICAPLDPLCSLIPSSDWPYKGSSGIFFYLFFLNQHSIANMIKATGGKKQSQSTINKY